MRLARFDPEQRRLSTAHWTGAIEAETAFADGFPLLVASTAALAELNRRLRAAGHARGDDAALPAQPRARRAATRMARTTSTRSSSTPPEGPVRLKLVKPCARCTIPDVDPATGADQATRSATRWPATAPMRAWTAR